MPPELPLMRHAPWRQRADSHPEDTLHTGLILDMIRGFFHRERPVSFCLPLPRVHAADGEAAQSAQFAQMPSHSSASVNGTLPAVLGKPEFPDTGWDRIKDLFERHPTQKYSEELTNVLKSGLVAAVAGLFYGGLPAAREARKRYIQMSQAEIYTGRVDAVRSAHNAAIRGFVRYGWRWSWRVAAFVTLFNTVSTGLSVYRDKSKLSHYAAAGAVTGGLFRLNLGLGGLVAGSIIGAVLGYGWLLSLKAPAGLMIISMQSLSGETVRERRQRERRELYELKLAEWEARLQLTDDLIGDLNVSSNTDEATKDLQRIEELLSSPPNKTTSSNQTGQSWLWPLV
ncbi:complex I assembly factor TIMMDC1, mitochondrial isoform X2 [Boleophthalmus pectinirostris]|uniref:complex I assembly factor TIMMDC1, mitochondrial isoform X2 n=1 Tax=Boleophthalmus pectinirostris TaxID=150288 RepID=UPI00242E9D20|nr:complex I assembly factor TIMMDC1, mitochondrial isoform X2 [Boleophthalmus pectinirostris]